MNRDGRSDPSEARIAPFRYHMDDGVCHIHVKEGVSPGSIRSGIMPFVNRIEARFPIAVHGVPYCFLPDAFELIIDDGCGKRMESCSDCSLRDVCSGFPVGSAIAEGDPIVFAPSLREVGIELNRSCLFRCGFCFFREDSKESRRVMPKEDVFKILDELRDMEVHAARFFGGDPVLRPDFLDILDYAKSKGLFTIINTNGVFNSLSEGSKIISTADLLIISLHGHDAKSQGDLTGRPDLFRDVLMSIRRIASACPEKLMVSTLVTGEFERNKDRYLELLCRLGVKRWSLNRQLFSPERSDSCVDLVRDKGSFIALAHWAKKVSKERGILIVLNDLPHCLLEEGERSLVTHNAQTNSMTRFFCDIRGFFKPTPSFSMDLGKDLAKAWKDSPMRWSSEPPIPKECRSCKVLMRCLGGSRSMAYLSTGKLDGKDPFMVGPIP